MSESQKLFSSSYPYSRWSLLHFFVLLSIKIWKDLGYEEVFNWPLNFPPSNKQKPEVTKRLSFKQLFWKIFAHWLFYITLKKNGMFLAMFTYFRKILLVCQSCFDTVHWVATWELDLCILVLNATDWLALLSCLLTVDVNTKCLCKFLKLVWGGLPRLVAWTSNLVIRLIKPFGNCLKIFCTF